MRAIIVVIAVVGGFSGCQSAQRADPMSRVRLGMSQSEVRTAIGPPYVIADRGSGVVRYYYNFNLVDFMNGAVSASGPYENTVNVISQRKLNPLEVGMTRDEVIFIIGPPNSRKAIRNQETLVYTLCTRYTAMGLLEPHCDEVIDHWVILADGRVTQFGKAGDFGSAEPTTIRLDHNINMNK